MYSQIWIFPTNYLYSSKKNVAFKYNYYNLDNILYCTYNFQLTK